jgi:hypothetical protein
MFGSDMLEVGIGLGLLFLLMSLICTAVREAIEGILKSRAKDLEYQVPLIRTGEPSFSVQWT